MTWSGWVYNAFTSVPPSAADTPIESKKTNVQVRLHSAFHCSYFLVGINC